ncbi:MAG: ATP-dependent zinc metalloprotease FtsH [Deferrisomatales bacterium]|nr:ATP-dependent zinc metalloprotease FtsH [Deferrisomatales bacterium]
MREPPRRGPRIPSWRVMVWFVAVWVLMSYFLQTARTPDRLELSYTDFLSHLEEDRVAEITIREDRITGTFRDPVSPEPESEVETPAEPREHTRFVTVIPSFGDPDLLGSLREKGVTVRAESSASPWYVALLVSFLPWVLLIGIFVYMSRKARERMGGMMGGQNPFSFGKSKARLYERSESKTTFEDVAGLANAKRELTEVVEFLKEPKRFRSLGAELPNGILLVGPPGTGKTLMARAVAGEAGVPFLSISGSEFIEMFVGVGASRVRDMFQKAKKEAPSIVFIDEVDSIGRVRGTGLGGGHDEREQTLNQILAEMDGFEPHESVVVLAATNRPDVLDPALIRPGRFDRRVAVEMPQRDARREILEIHTRGVPLAEGVDLDALAARTVGFSGADLKNLANEASLLAARKKKEVVDAEDFAEAVDKIRMGVEREDLLNEEERRIVAYHEAGHALVARLLPGTDPVEKVTIVPRGRSLGLTEQVPEEDRHNLKRSYLQNRLAVLLGGRVAELLVFEELTSGAENDLENATELARRMICRWGMSEKLGAVSYRQGEHHPFLGRELAQAKDFSEHTARLIDEEVHRTVQEMEDKAEDLLRSQRDKLDLLARALLEQESLSRDELDRLLGEGG